MPERAQVNSVEALQSFRTHVLLFLSKTRPVMEEISDEVRRTRAWLNEDQPNRWRHEVRRRSRILEEAQQALLGARLSPLQQATTAQQWAVTRAQRDLREAEAKLKTLKKWSQEFEHQSEPLIKQLDQVHTFLATDMRQAAAYLERLIQALQIYTEQLPVRLDAAQAAPPAENEVPPAAPVVAEKPEPMAGPGADDDGSRRLAP